MPDYIHHQSATRVGKEKAAQVFAVWTWAGETRLDPYDLPRELHDFPDTTRPQRVHNVRDQDATTLLIAHVEYWKNPLVVGTIYDAIEALSPSAPRQ